MRRGKSIFSFFLALLCVFVLGNVVLSPGKAEAQTIVKPALFDMNYLGQLRQADPLQDKWLAEFLANAEAILKETPVSVMDKKRTFVGDKHTYCSISRYAWPSDTNASVYIIKDGKINPEYADFDLPRLEILRDRLKALSVAYYITKDRRYYNCFVKHLKVWMLNKDTYMKPNLLYAQVQPGSNKNLGASYGLVELERFTPIIESICLIQSMKKLDRRTRKGVNKWFRDLLDWTLNSRQWAIESKGTNNVVSGLYVALVEMARFTGDYGIVKQLSSNYKENILSAQIDDEGKQPAELKRTIGYGYSVSNLNNVVDFCLIMEQEGVYYYQENQEKIDKAFEYLFQFEDNHEAFPYQQIGDWGFYERMLNRNAKRLSRMKAVKSAVNSKPHHIVTTKESIMDYVY